MSEKCPICECQKCILNLCEHCPIPKMRKDEKERKRITSRYYLDFNDVDKNIGEIRQKS